MSVCFGQSTGEPPRDAKRQRIAPRGSPTEAKAERISGEAGQRIGATNEPGTPLPDSKAELPPVIRRQEVVAFALVGLLIIAITAVLYVAKAFFLPVIMAFVVGTMLSPAAALLERYRIPRASARS